MTAKDLLDKYPIITDQMTYEELAVILRELQKVLQNQVEGDVVEFGCYEGTTALFMARLLKHYQGQTSARKRLWLFDSFAGLPEKTKEDDSPAGLQFRKGELYASKKKLIEHFKKANLLVPKIKKAWFSELTAADIPEQICFAFLDGDYYSSIGDSLRLVWSQVQSGGVIIIDDYQNEALPGVSKAVDEWAKLHGVLLRTEKSLAIIQL